MFRFTLALVTLGVVFASPTREEKFQDLTIIGGQDANINNYPWQISLQFRGSHFCGGFLISNTWVVTAAHCFDEGFHSSNLNIRAGTAWRSIGGQTANVRRYILHPQYNDTLYNNDIALVELTTPVTLGTSVGIARLPVAGQVIPDNTLITITGWGYTRVDGGSSTTLKEVTVPTINRVVCRRAYWGDETVVTPHMFCAGLLGVGGKDACQGDSGGPAVINGEVVGIVSWGISCAHPSFPGVYAKVSTFRNWIYLNTGI